MKRVVGDKELYPYYTLLGWSECISCKYEFRREKGWRKLSGPYYGGCGNWKYVCGECAPTKEEASDLFNRQPYLPDRPPAPPPPRSVRGDTPPCTR